MKSNNQEPLMSRPGKPQYCECGEGEDSQPSCHYQKFVKKTQIYGEQDKKQRIGFIKKVYGILFVMLATTAAIIVAALNVPFMMGCTFGGPEWGDICYDAELNPDVPEDAYKGFVAETWGPFLILAIVIVLALVFGQVGGDDDMPGQAFHMVVPINYILLAIFTVSVSIPTAKIALAAQSSNPGVVVEAAALLCAAVLGITIYAFTGFQKLEGVQEISFIGPALSAVGLVFGLALFFAVAPNEKLGCNKVPVDPEIPDGEMKCETDMMKLAYATIGMLLFSMIFLFDTSMVIGGKSMMFVLGPECYILGAIQLYLEIINMFILLLVILGDLSG